jgi:uncharacterized membrane protein
MTREAKVGRRVAYVLVFVGLFLVFFSLLLRFYAYPRLQKAPLNQYSQPVATGTGTYFDIPHSREVTGQLQNIRTVKGVPKSGNERTAVWDSFQVTKDLGTDGVIDAIQERIALDRVTAESLNCCGDQPRHEGLTLKFPFNTKKVTYSFWDSRAQRAFPAVFAGEERLQGVDVYRFEQHFSGVRLRDLDVSGQQAGQPDVATVPATLVYGNDRTLWVEPRSGIIVKGSENQSQIVQTEDGRPVLTGFRGQLTWDDATVRKMAHDAKAAASQLRMGETTLPVGALVLGVVLIVLGVVLTARQASRPQQPSVPDTESTRPADAL